MGLIDGLAACLVGIISSVLSRQLTEEFKAWTPWLIKRLVMRAIARLPEDQRERFGEEWRSHINEIPGEIGKIVVALGLLSAARNMSSILKARRERIPLGDILKRAVDVVFGTTVLVFYAPAFVLVSALIRLDSSGPVFQVEERIGLHGRKFPMYRFRTAPARAERMKTSRTGPRLTRIGKFLRITGFDHLPMFINVLRGEMSIIGPSAKGAYFVEQMSKLVPSYCERVKVRPGMTGWAQVNGAFDAHKELARDLYYIENRSLKLDVIILFRTVGATLMPSALFLSERLGWR